MQNHKLFINSRLSTNHTLGVGSIEGGFSFELRFQNRDTHKLIKKKKGKKKNESTKRDASRTKRWKVWGTGCSVLKRHFPPVKRVKRLRQSFLMVHSLPYTDWIIAETSNVHVKVRTNTHARLALIQNAWIARIFLICPGLGCYVGQPLRRQRFII